MKKNIYFTKKNYIMIVAGLLISVIGYALMAGGNPENPAEYSDEIFNFRRLTLAPFVVMGGYVVVLLGIIKVYKKDGNQGIDNLDEEVKPERRKK
ncbi:MAG: DUF3098 domain-containing protein [Flavobacteriales bacterium]